MRKFSAIVGGCALAALTASAANAALITFDLRAADGKTVNLAPGAAASVTLSLYAVWSPAAGENSYSKGYFGAKTVEAADGLLGNLSTMSYNADTMSNISTTGTVMNNDANADLELGNLTSGTTAAQFAYMTAGTAYVPAVNNELLLGTLTYNVTAAQAVAGKFTDANVFGRNATTISGFNFRANGTTYTGINAATNTNVAIGAPVHIQVTPEPATLSLLGIGAAGLLARRRRA